MSYLFPRNPYLRRRRAAAHGVGHLLAPDIVRLLTALHEAAHVVASMRLGLDFQHVTIDPDRVVGGTAGYSHSNAEGQVDEDIVHLLAPYFAEREWGVPQRLAEEVGEGDFRSVRRLLPQATVRLHTLIRRSEDLVQREWGAITNIAFELLTHKTLNREQVSSILETGLCGSAPQPAAPPPSLPALDLAEEVSRWAAAYQTQMNLHGKRLVQLTVRRYDKSTRRTGGRGIPWNGGRLALCPAQGGDAAPREDRKPGLDPRGGLDRPGGATDPPKRPSSSPPTQPPRGPLPALTSEYP